MADRWTSLALQIGSCVACPELVATRAKVVYRVQDNTFSLAIRDNGKGFDFKGDYARLTQGGHYGLAGMKERVEAIGGEFTVASEPGIGTTITIRGRLA